MSQRCWMDSLGDAVRFTGLVVHNEVARLMAAADVAVAPYPDIKQEIWLSPMKLFEYMASGTAVIASEVGQLAEVIHDGGNGVLVPPGNVPAMADALQRLIGEPSLRSRLGQRAREDAVRRHSWERYLSRLERVFAAVIAREPVNVI
jgi:glycosyltransferase involved in cell wall biosynthesis